ncbi:MAG: DUF1732 domain-containing protein [Nitrospira sp.]
MAKHFHQALRTLQRTLKLKGSIDIALMAGFRDVIVLSDQATDDPKLFKFVEQLGAKAVRDMATMRKKGGRSAGEDMLCRLACVRTGKTAIAGRASSVTQEAFDRMKLRVAKLLGETIPDLPSTQELAIYADRCDITEELVELDAHMVQFEQAVQHSEPVGKTLDFLLQEMGREVNTIGSKANDSVVTAEVVRMKAELERLREQVQNVE